MTEQEWGMMVRLGLYGLWQHRESQSDQPPNYAANRPLM